jgi:hypothetical protein
MQTPGTRQAVAAVPSSTPATSSGVMYSSWFRPRAPQSFISVVSSSASKAAPKSVGNVAPTVTIVNRSSGSSARQMATICSSAALLAT